MLGVCNLRSHPSLSILIYNYGYSLQVGFKCMALAMSHVNRMRIYCARMYLNGKRTTRGNGTECMPEPKVH